MIFCQLQLAPKFFTDKDFQQILHVPKPFSYCSLKSIHISGSCHYAATSSQAQFQFSHSSHLLVTSFAVAEDKSRHQSVHRGRVTSPQLTCCLVLASKEKTEDMLHDAVVSDPPQYKTACTHLSFVAVKQLCSETLSRSTFFQLFLSQILLIIASRYLPPYTTWFPFEENTITRDHSTESQGIRFLKSTVLSQLSYLTVFVIAICITEKRKLKEDPLNFNVLSIIVEVVR